MMKRYRWWFAVMIPACLVCVLGGIRVGDVCAVPDVPVLGAVVLDPIGPIEPVSVFANPDGVAELMDANPALLVAVLERHLTQRQVDAIEVELFPTPEPAEVRRTLVDAKLFLLKQRMPIDDATVVSIQSRIDSIVDPE